MPEDEALFEQDMKNRCVIELTTAEAKLLYYLAYRGVIATYRRAPYPSDALDLLRQVNNNIKARE